MTASWQNNIFHDRNLCWVENANGHHVRVRLDHHLILNRVWNAFDTWHDEGDEAEQWMEIYDLAQLV